MNAEFNWWLLIVGLVAGAGLVWLVIADWSRREQDVSEEERAAESAWIAQEMRDGGDDMDPATASQILALHREYLRRTGTLAASGEPSPGDDPEWSDEPDDRSDDLAAAWRLGAEAAPDAELEVQSDAEAPWSVRRSASEHRSVRSGSLLPSGGPPGTAESGPPGS